MFQKEALKDLTMLTAKLKRRMKVMRHNFGCHSGQTGRMTKRMMGRYYIIGCH